MHVIHYCRRKHDFSQWFYWFLVPVTAWWLREYRFIRPREISSGATQCHENKQRFILFLKDRGSYLRAAFQFLFIWYEDLRSYILNVAESCLTRALATRKFLLSHLHTIFAFSLATKSICTAKNRKLDFDNSKVHVSRVIDPVLAARMFSLIERESASRRLGG